MLLDVLSAGRFHLMATRARDFVRGLCLAPTVLHACRDEVARVHEWFRRVGDLHDAIVGSVAYGLGRVCSIIGLVARHATEREREVA